MMHNNWPELDYVKGKYTYKTIHMWTQIIGKIKLASMPWISHSWHVTLSVTPNGLSTGTITHKDKFFQIDLDFLKHQLKIVTSAQEERVFDLQNLSVKACYQCVFSCLDDFGIDIKINPVPSELADVIPFDKDDQNRTYDPNVAKALHYAFLSTNAAFTAFRAGFVGKSSPVHFFWGGFDLAVSRFSGREAPLHPGGIPNMPDWVAQEAYSHEVFSCGFWPGNEAVPYANFYTYIYPEPEGFNNAEVKPDAAFYHQDLREFMLPYEEVRKASDPSAMLLDFLQSTYESAADLAGWDRERLERRVGEFVK